MCFGGQWSEFGRFQRFQSAIVVFDDVNKFILTVAFVRIQQLSIRSQSGNLAVSQCNRSPEWLL